MKIKTLLIGASAIGLATAANAAAPKPVLPTVVNITGATVVLKFRSVGSDTLQATVTGTVTSGSTGQVAFYPASTPAMLTGDAGDYEGEIEITFSDGQIQTVYDTLKFKIREDF